jgi:hypothetical protein
MVHNSLGGEYHGTPEGGTRRWEWQERILIMDDAARVSSPQFYVRHYWTTSQSSVYTTAEHRSVRVSWSIAITKATRYVHHKHHTTLPLNILFSTCFSIPFLLYVLAFHLPPILPLPSDPSYSPHLQESHKTFLRIAPLLFNVHIVSTLTGTSKYLGCCTSLPAICSTAFVARTSFRCTDATLGSYLYLSGDKIADTIQSAPAVEPQGHRRLLSTERCERPQSAQIWPRWLVVARCAAYGCSFAACIGVRISEEVHALQNVWLHTLQFRCLKGWGPVKCTMVFSAPQQQTYMPSSI